MVELSKVKGVCGRVFGVYVKHWKNGSSVYCYNRADGVHTLVTYPNLETQNLLNMFCSVCPLNKRVNLNVQ